MQGWKMHHDVLPPPNVRSDVMKGVAWKPLQICFSDSSIRKHGIYEWTVSFRKTHFV